LQDSVEETLERIVLKVTRKKNVKFSLKTRFEDLDADSLDKVQVLVKLEETYYIELPDDEVRNVSNMGGFVDLIKRKIAEKSQKSNQ
jgi:acyl carrier protein